jgi:hypothetical protein
VPVRLFQNSVEEKLARERTGHTSNALFTYQNNPVRIKTVSNVLGPCTGKLVEAQGDILDDLALFDVSRSDDDLGHISKCQILKITDIPKICWMVYQHLM